MGVRWNPSNPTSYGPEIYNINKIYRDYIEEVRSDGYKI